MNEAYNECYKQLEEEKLKNKQIVSVIEDVYREGHVSGFEKGCENYDWRNSVSKAMLLDLIGGETAYSEEAN